MFRALMLSWLLAAPAFAAPNPELAKAEKHFEALKYTEAEKALKAALMIPKNDRGTILRIYELQGIIDATVGKKSALEHFRKLVALDPDHVLSRDLGPRILAPFYEAKARLDENPPLQLMTSSAWAEGELKLHVTVQSDLLKLASKMAIFWKLPDGRWTSKIEPVRPSYDLPVSGDAIDWYVNLLGAYEGVVMEAGSAAEPLKAPSVLPQPLVADQPTVSVDGQPMIVAPRVERPMSTRRKIAIGVASGGVAALIGAGAFGLSSQSARSQIENPQRDEAGRPIGINGDRARALEAQAVGSAIGANVLVVTGAALVGVGAFLWFGDSSSKVAIVPSPNGAAIVGILP